VIMETLRQIIPFIRQHASRTIPTGLYALRNELLARYGNAVLAILFHGSCFRKGDASDGLVDLYLLVNSYRDAYHKHLHRTLNRLLPPNVFYLEITVDDIVVRAKYTVISLADFQRGTSMNWFHSYLWGRFAQPAGILYSRHESIADVVYSALAQAVITFMTRTLPIIPAQFDARILWNQGLLLSYRAELRPEFPDKLVRLFEWAPQYYEQLTRIAMGALPYSVDAVTRDASCHYHAQIPIRIRFVNRLAWRVRFIQGKLLSLLRLLKGLLTFKGGIDYVLWKIERHSGITIAVTPRLRRIPFLGIFFIFWRLYRGGAFR
jgi:hypothetical protein